MPPSRSAHYPVGSRIAAYFTMASDGSSESELFSKGDRVECGTGRKPSGVIARCNEDGTYDVECDGGRVEKGVEKRLLLRQDPFFGVITASCSPPEENSEDSGDSGAATWFDVKFDDGELYSFSGSQIESMIADYIALNNKPDTAVGGKRANDNDDAVDSDDERPKKKASKPGAALARAASSSSSSSSSSNMPPIPKKSGATAASSVSSSFASSSSSDSKLVSSTSSSASSINKAASATATTTANSQKAPPGPTSDFPPEYLRWLKKCLFDVTPEFRDELRSLLTADLLTLCPDLQDLRALYGTGSQKGWYRIDWDAKRRPELEHERIQREECARLRLAQQGHKSILKGRSSRALGFAPAEAATLTPRSEALGGLAADRAAPRGERPPEEALAAAALPSALLNRKRDAPPPIGVRFGGSSRKSVAAIDFEDALNFAAAIGKSEAHQRAGAAAAAGDFDRACVDGASMGGEDHPADASFRYAEMKNQLLGGIISFATDANARLKCNVMEEGRQRSNVPIAEVKPLRVNGFISDVVQQWLFYAHGSLGAYRRAPVSDRVFLNFESPGIDKSRDFIVRTLMMQAGKGLWMPDIADANVLAMKVLEGIKRLSECCVERRAKAVSKRGFSDAALKMKVSLDDEEEDGTQQGTVSLCYYDQVDSDFEKLVKMQVFKPHFEMLLDAYQSNGNDCYNQKRLMRIFVMLTRYRCFGELRAGAQASVTAEVWRQLRLHFEVDYECFASPLNRTCRNYCSLFSDSDGFFGSSGSFFEFEVPPGGGSFEVNPPFDSETTMSCFKRIKYLLEKSRGAGEPLSFFVVLPHNEESQIALRNFGRDCRVLETLAATKDGEEGVKPTWFTMGMQHLKYNVAKFGDEAKLIGGAWQAEVPTICCWLQNDEGFKKWTPTKAKVDAVCNAFHEKPSQKLFQIYKRYAAHPDRDVMIKAADEAVAVERELPQYVWGQQDSARQNASTSALRDWMERAFNRLPALKDKEEMKIKIREVLNKKTVELRSSEGLKGFSLNDAFSWKTESLPLLTRERTKPAPDTAMKDWIVRAMRQRSVIRTDEQAVAEMRGLVLAVIAEKKAELGNQLFEHWSGWELLPIPILDREREEQQQHASKQHLGVGAPDHVSVEGLELDDFVSPMPSSFPQDVVSSRRTLCIRNPPEGTDLFDITNFFGAFGEIQQVDFPSASIGERHHVAVLFETRESVTAALKAFQKDGSPMPAPPTANSIASNQRLQFSMCLAFDCPKCFRFVRGIHGQCRCQTTSAPEKIVSALATMRNVNRVLIKDVPLDIEEDDVATVCEFDFGKVSSVIFRSHAQDAAGRPVPDAEDTRSDTKSCYVRFVARDAAKKAAEKEIIKLQPSGRKYVFLTVESCERDGLAPPWEWNDLS